MPALANDGRRDRAARRLGKMLDAQDVVVVYMLPITAVLFTVASPIVVLTSLHPGYGICLLLGRCLQTPLCCLPLFAIWLSSPLLMTHWVKQTIYLHAVYAQIVMLLSFMFHVCPRDTTPMEEGLQSEFRATSPPSDEETPRPSACARPEGPEQQGGRKLCSTSGQELTLLVMQALVLIENVGSRGPVYPLTDVRSLFQDLKKYEDCKEEDAMTGLWCSDAWVDLLKALAVVLVFLQVVYLLVSSARFAGCSRARSPLAVGSPGYGERLQGMRSNSGFSGGPRSIHTDQGMGSSLGRFPSAPGI